MAETAAEYKDRLLRQLSGDAFLAEREASWFARELNYAETEAIEETLREKMEEATARGEWLRSVIPAVEDVDLF